MPDSFDFGFLFTLGPRGSKNVRRSISPQILKFHLCFISEICQGYVLRRSIVTALKTVFPATSVKQNQCTLCSNWWSEHARIRKYNFLSVTSVHDIVWDPQTLNFDEYWTDWMAHGSNGLLDHPTGNDWMFYHSGRQHPQVCHLLQRDLLRGLQIIKRWFRANCFSYWTNFIG